MIWAVGSTQIITWMSLDILSNIKLEISRDNGIIWELLISDITDNGSYSWVVTGPTTTQAIIRISGLEYTNLDDDSVIDFSNITYTNEIPFEIANVDTPSILESYIIGSTHTITWTPLDVLSDVKIELSRDGGSTWEIIDSNTSNNGVYYWFVSGDVTDEALIKISGLEYNNLEDGSVIDFTNISDISNMFFRIILPLDLNVPSEYIHRPEPKPDINWINIFYNDEYDIEWITIYRSVI